MFPIEIKHSGKIKIEAVGMVQVLGNAEAFPRLHPPAGSHFRNSATKGAKLTARHIFNMFCRHS